MGIIKGQTLSGLPYQRAYFLEGFTVTSLYGRLSESEGVTYKAEIFFLEVVHSQQLLISIAESTLSKQPLEGCYQRDLF